MKHDPYPDRDFNWMAVYFRIHDQDRVVFPEMVRTLGNLINHLLIDPGLYLEYNGRIMLYVARDPERWDEEEQTWFIRRLEEAYARLIQMQCNEVFVEGEPKS